MNDIKVIKDLAPCEVWRRANNGEPVASRVDPSKFPNLDLQNNEWREVDTFNPAGLHTYEFAIIDTHTPDIDWDGFDWDFFNQYGGLMVEIGGGNFSVSSMADATRNHDSYEPRESPPYYWPGGKQPVPDNVEVEYIRVDLQWGRFVERETAGNFNWQAANVIAFKLTWRVI